MKRQFIALGLFAAILPTSTVAQEYSSIACNASRSGNGSRPKPRKAICLIVARIAPLLYNSL